MDKGNDGHNQTESRTPNAQKPVKAGKPAFLDTPLNYRGFFQCCVVIAIVLLMAMCVMPEILHLHHHPRSMYEAEVKRNLHAIQLALERYSVDAPDGEYPLIIMGGDWTDSYIVWQEWVENQVNLDPSIIANEERRNAWVPAAKDVGDPLVMESYMPSYPHNPFMKQSRGLLPRIHHHPRPGIPGALPFWRVVGGRESNKMFEVFGPAWKGKQSIAGDFYVHHIFNNPHYDFEQDLYKRPVDGWLSPSGNAFLVGNFSYWPRGEKDTAWSLPTASKAIGYTLAGYGSPRTAGQDVYNRNGNYKGRYRTESCESDCMQDFYHDDIPCICTGNATPTPEQNNGGSDTLPDGVVITLDSGLDKKSSRVNVDITEGESAY